MKFFNFLTSQKYGCASRQSAGGRLPLRSGESMIQIMRATVFYTALPVLVFIVHFVPAMTAEIQEFRQYYFENYGDIESNNILRKGGWIPEWLPKSSSNIYLTYTIDQKFAEQNREWITFDFSPTDEFFKKCQLLNREAMMIRIPNIDAQGGFFKAYYPKPVRELIAATHREDIAMYRCRSRAVKILAVDHIRSQGYAWTFRIWEKVDFDYRKYISHSEMLASPLMLHAELAQVWNQANLRLVEVYGPRFSDETWAVLKFNDQKNLCGECCQEIPETEAGVPPQSNRYWRPGEAMHVFNVSSRTDPYLGPIQYYRCEGHPSRYLAIDRFYMTVVLWQNLHEGERSPVPGLVHILRD